MFGLQVTFGLVGLIFFSSTANGKLLPFEGVGPVQELDAALSIEEDEGLSLAEKCLHAHNEFRKLHVDTPNLAWDEELRQSAQAYAEKLARRNDGLSLGHDTKVNKENGWGENLYYKDAARKGGCADAVLSWYNEIDNYNFASGSSSNGGVIGHFTQVAWKTTTNVGVGIATAPSKIMPGINTVVFVVAKYSPPGNYRGRYTEFVMNLLPGGVRPTSPQQIDPSICLADGLPQNYCNYFKSAGQCATNPMVKDGCYKSCEICSN